MDPLSQDIKKVHESLKHDNININLCVYALNMNKLVKLYLHSMFQTSDTYLLRPTI